ncbi:hypothetical protein KPH14_007954 [Odynerus spinipes]|uniref:Uncharacterized protein n=1 Tax=Odynerus spinipes TaxID=1348599 RepID=A0AAD9RK13_9HYME|nr:hypothetical protein KPH14_007954 [Odynerus spinipes]
MYSTVPRIVPPIPRRLSTSTIRTSSDQSAVIFVRELDHRLPRLRRALSNRRRKYKVRRLYGRILVIDWIP